MGNVQKKYIMSCFFILLAAATLAACGSSSSSTTATTVPSSATVFYAHNLVFRNSTTLSTGYNAFGQLGTGTLTNRSVPGKLKHYYPYAGFATGGDHTVAFFNNSTVRSWGYNANGQLGNNSTTYSSVPVTASDISGVTAVAAGAFHTLALKNDGSVWAWGSNDVGQLGIGWNLTKLKEEKIPHEVTGVTGAITNISMIAANGRHSLALANDGKVWAWGGNSHGQLGIDPVTTSALADPGVVPGLLSGATAISAGGGFSYAVDSVDGTVWAWGVNGNGQLGNGAVTVENIEGCNKQQNYCFKPYRVEKSDKTYLADIVQVAGGIQHGLARDKNGNVWAWGYNFFGQLGNNKQDDSAFAVPVVIKDAQGTVLTGATDIRAFGSSSMAKIGGVWYVWGDNSYGQLGIATNTHVLLPKKMSGF